MSWRLVGLLWLLLCRGAALAQAPAVPADASIQRGIVYRTVAGTPLRLDLYRPAGATGPLPVVLLLHGGSWATGDRDAQRSLALDFVGLQAAVVVPDYRLVPASRYPAQLEDVRAAAAWLRAHAAAQALDPARCIVAGVSAGGQLAGLLATQPDTSGLFAGAILLAAPCDLTVAPPSLAVRSVLRMYLGADRAERPDLYAAASPITHISADDPPFLLLHGADDRLVPTAQSARMAAALRACGVPAALQLLPGLGHAVPAPSSPLGLRLQEAIGHFLRDPRGYAQTSP